MPRSWWLCIVAVGLTGAVAYRYVHQPSPPAAPVVVSDHADQPPVAQEPVLPPASVADAQPEEKQVQDVAPAPAVSPPAQLDSPPKEARLEDAAAPVAVEAAPATIPPVAVAVEGPARSDEKPDLSYLHYYAYSEVQPETKPADTVLDFLKAVPREAPVDEIRRVSDLLKLDFSFMKTVAKIESGFDPKQRTGSYIGLFQLSKKEFAMYGSGDILDARDNTVAAAMKFMTENILFEMFTRRTPTFNDIYLIHQQGVEGAVELLSQPHRLAWR